MAKAFNKVYQFKITLKGIKPPIWRRIQVPKNYTFWDLHVAIQDAMGWLDVHLHAFEIANPGKGPIEEIGIPDKDFEWENQRTIAGWKRTIARYFTPENAKARYVYDFGDDWTHDIKLEKILPREKGVNYPLCLDGKRACPPENCGGVWGYEELLEIISNPKHEQYEEMIEWLGEEDLDPDYFDRTEVQFSDPKKSLKSTMECEESFSEGELADVEDDFSSNSLLKNEKEKNKEQRRLSRDLMHRIWQKAKAKDFKSLKPEERRLARIMLDHEDEYFNQFEFADLTYDHQYELDIEENPFLHIFIHSIVEAQLEEKDPIEAVQFYNAMQKKGCCRHDAVHLIGAILAPVMFSVINNKVPFDMDTYIALLKKYKSKTPEKIMDLLEDEELPYPAGI